MTHEHRHDPFETSDAARLKRGWRMADAWLAALMSLAGLALGALPERLPLAAHVRLAALRHIRKLEALVRRLALAMATPQAGARPAIPAPLHRPPRVEHIVLDPARLGLARHWRPQDAAPPPETEPARAPRAPVAPTISLVEAWPDMRPSVSDRPFDPPRRSAGGAWIRSFDGPFIPAPEPVRAAPDPHNLRLLKRLAAIRAVVADPSRMVRRMSRWLARRGDARAPDFRPSPLCIGTPRLGWTPDERDIVQDAQALARQPQQPGERQLWCDSS